MRVPVHLQCTAKNWHDEALSGSRPKNLYRAQLETRLSHDQASRQISISLPYHMGVSTNVGSGGMFAQKGAGCSAKTPVLSPLKHSDSLDVDNLPTLLYLQQLRLAEALAKA